MPTSPSTRLALVGPAGTDTIAQGDDQIRAIITQLETVGAGFRQGTSRPAAAAALAGYFYVNTSTGLLSYCTGSVWLDFQAHDSDLDALAALALSNGQVVGKTGGSIAAIYPPGYEIGYDQRTAQVPVDATNEASGTGIISCAAHTFDGGPVMVEFFTPIAGPGSGDQLYISLFEGATQIGRLCSLVNGAQFAPLLGRLMFTPSAGSHTYTVTAYIGPGGSDGTVGAGAGGTGAYVPMFIRFTKV